MPVQVNKAATQDFGTAMLTRMPCLGQRESWKQKHHLKGWVGVWPSCSFQQSIGAILTFLPCMHGTWLRNVLERTPSLSCQLDNQMWPHAVTKLHIWWVGPMFSLDCLDSFTFPMPQISEPRIWATKLKVKQRLGTRFEDCAYLPATYNKFQCCKHPMPCACNSDSGWIEKCETDLRRAVAKKMLIEQADLLDVYLPNT